MKLKALFVLALIACIPFRVEAQVTLRDIQECDKRIRECEALCMAFAELGFPEFESITYYYCAMRYCKPIHDELQCRAASPLGDIYGGSR